MSDSDNRPVVLAVDDTPENLDVVKGILVPDYRVLVATNGAAALKIAGKKAPDIVLLDIMMPDMDGYEVCRRLKADPATAEIPVIFLTAKDQTEDEAVGFSLGAADYILKPVNPPILQARVATHVALKQHVDALARAKQRMEFELSVGRDIQYSMLPAPLAPRPEMTLSASMVPAREVGGDFYDFFMSGADELHFCVADVSGKGVPSALFMAMSKVLIKAHAADGALPSRVMERANEVLSEDNPECMFVTVFLGVLNLSSGVLRYCNAGHNPPLLRRADGAVAELAGRHGPILGVMPGQVYEGDEVLLAPGDQLLVYTDGVTEAMNPEEALYGEERLETLHGEQARPAAELLDAIAASVSDFAGAAEQADDITLLALDYHGRDQG